MKSLFRYTYRDASNYKEHEQVVVEGALVYAHISPYLGVLDSNDFIPYQLHVGMEELQGRMLSFPSGDDVCVHEVDEIEIVEDNDPRLKFSRTLMVNDKPVTAQQLVDAFKKAKEDGWDITAACERLGLEGAGDSDDEDDDSDESENYG